MVLNLSSALDFLIIPCLTSLGCVTAFVYCEHKGFEKSQNFFRQMLPGKSDTFYFRSDFIISAILGTVIGIVIYSPTTEYQALAAGLGWTAAFSIVKSDGKSRSAHSP